MLFRPASFSLAEVNSSLGLECFKIEIEFSLGRRSFRLTSSHPIFPARKKKNGFGVNCAVCYIYTYAR